MPVNTIRINYQLMDGIKSSIRFSLLLRNTYKTVKEKLKLHT
jgi:hypothetical protein